VLRFGGPFLHENLVQDLWAAQSRWKIIWVCGGGGSRFNRLLLSSKGNPEVVYRFIVVAMVLRLGLVYIVRGRVQLKCNGTL
jgi:hypothetical protein